MTIDFPIPDDGIAHQFCLSCKSENIQRIFKEEKSYFKCASCNETHARRIVIDPAVVWWVDNDTKEYWHESVGMFIFNQHGQILLFQRQIFPFACTIPAGHLDTGEQPDQAVMREVVEEVGLAPENVTLVSSEKVVGDECSRGSDSHLWHLYKGVVKGDIQIVQNDEGNQADWFTLEQALGQELTYPVRYFLENFGYILLVKS